MSLGFITMDERGAADQLLAALVQDLVARGVPVAGMVAHDPAPRGCEMSLALFPGGPVVDISQDLGVGADACTLDPGALEQAVAWVMGALEQVPPGTVLVLSKFGKQEAAGRGCRPLIAEGLERGLRTLVSVPPETRAEFLDFAGDLARELPSDPSVLRAFLTHAAAEKV